MLVGNPSQTYMFHRVRGLFSAVDQLYTRFECCDWGEGDDRGGSVSPESDDWVMPDPGQVMTGVGHVRLQVMTG